MTEIKKGSVVGVNGVELLQIAFIVLKLTHVIDWSWWRRNSAG